MKTLEKKPNTLTAVTAEDARREFLTGCILNSPLKRHAQHFLLFKLGYTAEQISKLTGSTPNNVRRSRWAYKTSHYQLGAERELLNICA